MSPRSLVLPSSLTLLLLSAGALEAHQGDPPRSLGTNARTGAPAELVELPAISRTELLAEDEARLDGPGPLRFALPLEVDLGPGRDGTWTELADGRLWRLRVRVPGASDLNLGFGRFALPPGATLHVIGAGDYYQGPYGADHNRKHGELWTPVVPGDEATVELFVPADAQWSAELRLARVGAGYRDLFGGNPLIPRQGSCNNDVVCPEGDPWTDEIRSVAVYGTNGSTFCTGTLVHSVPGDFRNFFLTADHCGISPGNAPSVVVYWNFESPTCGQLGGGILSDNTSGAIHRAADGPNDMSLIELDSEIDPAYGVYYAGWDARPETVPAGSVGIHHPGTDEKAISFNDDLLSTDDSCIGSGGVDSHWWVDDWEDGTTEPGSSGSGLWDPDTHLLVGYLSGGLASCTNISYDCYGKFSVGWDRGLSDWLDPADTGTLFVAGSDPSPTVGYRDNAGIDACPAQPALENGIWEPGETISVTVDLRATGDFTGVHGTLGSTTPGVAVTVAEADWPDLVSGQTATSLSAFELEVHPTVACFSTVDLELDVTTNEGGPFHLAFGHSIGQSLSADLPLPLVDSGTSESPLDVAQDVILSDVLVEVAIDHTYVGDLEVVLRSPAGTEVTLLDRPGVPASPFGCSDNDLEIVFDDDSGVLLESHCAGTTPWYQGAAAPVEPLATLDGESTAGTWTLVVTDHAGQDTGQLVDWQLVTVPPLSGQCGQCDAGIFADGFESGDATMWDLP